MGKEVRQRRIVRVFHDYGSPWPLWESGSDKYAMDPTDYHLSANLTAILRECGELFETHNVPVDGWTSHERRQQYLNLMREAVDQLRAELSGVADVSVEVPGLSSPRLI